MVVLHFFQVAPKGLVEIIKHVHPFLLPLFDLVQLLLHVGGEFDLEYIREDFSVGDLINELFSPGEILACKALPPDEQQRTFFLWWTRKEAWLKARGSGLALDPRDIDLSRLRAISGMLPEIYEDGRGLALYSVTDVDAGDRFAAALAVEGHCWQLKCWQWESSLLCSGTDMIY